MRFNALTSVVNDGESQTLEVILLHSMKTLLLSNTQRGIPYKLTGLCYLDSLGRLSMQVTKRPEKRYEFKRGSKLPLLKARFSKVGSAEA